MAAETVTELISEEQIQNRINGLAAEITRDYAGEELTLVCVLKGGVVFMVDLARRINLPVEYDFMEISSYGDLIESSGNIKINKDMYTSVDGKNVLLIEDIIDTGRTIDNIIRHIKSKNPKSFKICTLLDKKERREHKEIKVDYTGFAIPDRFVVGYGLDYAQKYRNLNFIGILNFN